MQIQKERISQVLWHSENKIHSLPDQAASNTQITLSLAKTLVSNTFRHLVCVQHLMYTYIGQDTKE